MLHKKRKGGCRLRRIDFGRGSGWGNQGRCDIVKMPKKVTGLGGGGGGGEGSGWMCTKN